MAITLITTVAVPSSQASIDFNSIPGTYTDLMLVVSARTDRANTSSDLYLQFNGVTTATYSFRRLYGSGSGGGGSDSLTNQSNGGLFGFADGASSTASTFGSINLYIPNYAGASAKSWSSDGIHENNAVSSNQGIYAGLWSGTAAITSISIKDYNSANFVQYSTASLYGITKGSSGGVTVA